MTDRKDDEQPLGQTTIGKETSDPQEKHRNSELNNQGKTLPLTEQEVSHVHGINRETTSAKSHKKRKQKKGKKVLQITALPLLDRKKSKDATVKGTTHKKDASNVNQGHVKILKRGDLFEKECQNKESDTAGNSMLEGKTIKRQVSRNKIGSIQNGTITFVESYTENFQGTISELELKIKATVGSEIPFSLDSVELLKNQRLFTLLKFPSKTKANLFCIKLSKSVSDLEICVAICDGKINQPKFDISWFDDIKEEKILIHQRKINETEEKLKLHKGSLKGTSNETRRKRELTIETLNEKLEELQKQAKEFTEAIDKQRVIFLKTCISDLNKEYESCRCIVRRECTKLANNLPIYAFRAKILQTIHQHQVCVLLGETGSGKSTQLPAYLYETTLIQSGTVVCTEPRKIAAITLAKHTSEEMNLELGKEIGYQVGRDKKSCRNTKLLYMTDHVLLNECVKDPYLSHYSCVIIDEAHERSIYTDLLLGMVREALVKRPDLKVIITSATIDPYIFVQYFGGEQKCPIIKVPGRLFPVATIYNKVPKAQDDDHVESAVNKVLEIHRKNIPGNILVFLATPLETEKATKVLEGKVDRSKSVKPLQLHGRLQPNEQQAVFDPVPRNCRKVIFSTNVAETSVTIPDIGIVVDTGLAKEKKYDAKKNMSVLELANVSQSSANQRLGRAGRTGPGTCYRLYTEPEFHDMEKSAIPEILQANLGHALLKLVELGVSNPIKFQFVETPGKQALELAMHSLYEIGAIDRSNGQLTRLGQQLAKMSLEPRFGKAVIRGIELGIGDTMTLLVAYASSGSQLFHRGASEEANFKSDCLKLNFCKEEGDFMTFLNVYRQWESLMDREKTAWCMEHAINGKTLKTVRDIASEIKFTIKKELSMKCLDTEKVENMSEMITEIMMLSFPENISRYTEHQESGYAMVSSNMCVKVHPSSALKSLSHTTKWIVFTHLLKTTQDFALNVSPVSDELLNKLIEEGQVHIDIDKANKKILQPVHLGYFSDYILNQLTGPRHTTRKAIQDDISNNCSQCPVTIDINFNEGSCILYIPKNHLDYGTNILNEKIDYMKDEMIMETILSSIDKDGISSVMAVIGQGGIVQHILNPDEFLTFQFKCNTLQESDEVLAHLEARNHLKSYEENEERHGITVTVSFTHPREAAYAFYLLMDRFNPWTSQKASRKPEYQVKLSWVRRPLHGFAVCKFSDPSMALLTHCLIPSVEKFEPGNVTTPVYDTNLHVATYLRGRLCRDPAEIVFESIDKYSNPSQVEKELEQFVAEHCQIAKVEEVVVPRVHKFATSPRDKERYHRIISEALRSIVSTFYLDIPLPKESAPYLTCWVTLSNAVDRNRVANIKSIILDTRFSNVYVQVTGTILITKKVLQVTEEKLDQLLKEVNQGFEENVVKKITKKGHAQINLQCRTVEDLTKIKTEIENICGAEEIVCQHADQPEYQLFEPDSVKHIYKTANETQTYINIDRIIGKVRIYGTQYNKRNALQQIYQLLENIEDTKYVTMSLRGPEKPPGLLRAIVKKFGVDMEKLRKQNDLKKLKLNLQRHSFEIRGPEDCISNFHKAIDVIMMEISEGNIPEKQCSSPICSLCFCPVEGKVKRLQECGHGYCMECLTGLIQSSIQYQNFPITCAHENCGSLILLKDLKIILKDDLKELVQSSVGSYVKKHPDEVKPCVTPDCEVVFHTTQLPGEFVCPQCHVQTCTKCGLPAHENHCYDDSHKEKIDQDITKWLKADTLRRGLCPFCKTCIEKKDDSSCFHMTCKGCKKHVCWKCKDAYFSTRRECYNHLAQECGGIF